MRAFFRDATIGCHYFICISLPTHQSMMEGPQLTGICFAKEASLASPQRSCFLRLYELGTRSGRLLVVRLKIQGEERGIHFPYLSMGDGDGSKANGRCPPRLILFDKDRKLRIMVVRYSGDPLPIILLMRYPHAIYPCSAASKCRSCYAPVSCCS